MGLHTLAARATVTVPGAFYATGRKRGSVSNVRHLLHKGDSASVEEIARRVNAGFLPLVSGAPGFAAYSLMDIGNGVVITLGAFQDRAGADASTRMAAEWVKDNLCAPRAAA